MDYYSDMIEQFEKACIQEAKAAIDFRGKMVDVAAIQRAKRVLEKHQLLKHLSN